MANQPSDVLHAADIEWTAFPGGELEGQRPRRLCPSCRRKLQHDVAQLLRAASPDAGLNPPLQAEARRRPLCFGCYRLELDREKALKAAGELNTASEARFQETLSREDPDRDLWFSDPDACCRIRKVEPLARALKPFDAWLNGRKRFQGNARTDIPVVEDDGARLKFNPFANVSREELEAIFVRAKLPRHPLVESGFLSVGCMPCTSRTAEGEDARAGRWRGRAKTECGIHTMKTS